MLSCPFYGWSFNQTLSCCVELEAFVHEIFQATKKEAHGVSYNALLPSKLTINATSQATVLVSKLVNQMQLH